MATFSVPSGRRLLPLGAKSVMQIPAEAHAAASLQRQARAPTTRPSSSSLQRPYLARVDLTNPFTELPALPSHGRATTTAAYLEHHQVAASQLPAAAAARRRLLAFAVSAVKPAPMGPTAMGLLDRDPAVVAAKCTVPSGRYPHPSSSAAAADAYLSNGAASSSIKGTGGECFWPYGCAADSSENLSCGAGCYTHPSSTSAANAYISYGAGTPTTATLEPQVDDTGSRITVGILSSIGSSRGVPSISGGCSYHPRPHVLRRVSAWSSQVRTFAADASSSGNAKPKAPEECKFVCSMDSTRVMEKLDSIHQKVSETGEQHNIINHKVDGAVEACSKLRSDVDKLQEAQKGSGDWTSIKIFGKNLNMLAVGRAIADIWNKIPK